MQPSGGRQRSVHQKTGCNLERLRRATEGAARLPLSLESETALRCRERDVGWSRDPRALEGSPGDREEEKADAGAGEALSRCPCSGALPLKCPPPPEGVAGSEVKPEQCSWALCTPTRGLPAPRPHTIRDAPREDTLM
ncbi:hypothetical protein NDU88_003849 [Pleurodeles waltl]|uniref:Uncharacterized protein n=1 Tax=Pleurodeles waltl TaxID=8319 RepID=A0AAV7SH90_PLEWA|nr:hypothetical protein NDU88_003849 [Pleurodeles waltl]